MCCHGYDDWGCYGWHHHPGRNYGPRWRYSDEPAQQDRRGYLEDEKRALEQRLKEIEGRLAETTK